MKIGNFWSSVTLKFDGLPWKTTGHLFYATSCFVHHSIAIGEFKLELQSGHVKFRTKLVDILSCLTLKLDRWPWKTIGHLSYSTSSFVYHFIAIGEITLELQSGNAQVGSKLANFLSPVTLRFDVWLWKNKQKKTIEQLSYATSSFVHYFITICEFKLDDPETA